MNEIINYRTAELFYYCEQPFDQVKSDELDEEKMLLSYKVEGNRHKKFDRKFYVSKEGAFVEYDHDETYNELEGEHCVH